MKKEVEVKIDKTEKQTRYFCDLCEKEYDFKYTQSSCYVCHRDVCSDCSILTDDTNKRILEELPDELKNKINELGRLKAELDSKEIREWAKVHGH